MVNESELIINKETFLQEFLEILKWTRLSKNIYLLGTTYIVISLARSNLQSSILENEAVILLYSLLLTQFMYKFSLWHECHIMP